MAELEDELRAARGSGHAVEVQRALAQARASLLGRDQPLKVGRYALGDCVGSGGCGRVYAATDPELDREVAVKLVRPGSAAGEPVVAKSRLLREARTLAQLSHPNVVEVYDVGEFGDHVFLAMEYVRGATLRQWLRAAERSWSAVVDVLADAGRGLLAAHAVGIVHRDFKPDNVVVGDDGRVRVLDFGLAQAEVEGEPTPRSPTGSLSSEALVGDLDGPPTVGRAVSGPLTRSGVVAGTPPYMAPEQLRREPATPAVDQWSFCVTLYEALAGRRPFAATAEILDADVAVPPPPEGRAPRFVWRVIARGLQRDPRRRFADVGSLLRALRGRPGRQWWWLGAAAAVGTVAALAPGGRAKTCDAGERMAGVWDPARRAEVVGALSSAGVPYASPTARTVGQLLDDYATTWRDAFARACEAGADAEGFDATMACLERRRTGFVAVVDVLAERGAQVLPRAVAATAGLEPVLSCQSASGAGPPAEITERASSIEADLARVKALTATGDYDAAIARARSARDAAVKTGYPPLEARTSESLGAALAAAGQLDEAEQRLMEAVGQAREIGDARLEARTAARFLHIKGWLRHDFEAALEWERHARAAAQRLESSTLSMAAIDGDMAVVYYAKGEYDNARESALKAISVWTPERGSDHYTLGPIYLTLGNTELSGGEVADARKYFTHAYELLVDTLGADHPMAMRAETGLGHCDHVQSKHEAALERYADVLRRLRGSLTEDHIDLVMALVNYGLGLRSLGRNDEAQAAFEEGLSVAERLLGEAHPHTASAVSNLASIELDRGAFDRARELELRSLSIREVALTPSHPEVAKSLTTLGAIELQAGNPSQALAYYDRALALRPSRSSALIDHLGRAEALVELGNAEAADLALSRVEASDDSGWWRVSFVRAKILWAQGQHAAARHAAGSARAAVPPSNSRAAHELTTWRERH